MNKTTEIIIILLVLIIIICGGWWVWSETQEPKPKEMTCDEKCKSLGYISGECREFSISDESEKCKENEANIGLTWDCVPVTLVAGKDSTCCCKVTEDETANWETYSNEEYGYEIKYPREWLVNKLRDDAQVVFSDKNMDSLPPGYSGPLCVLNIMIHDVIYSPFSQEIIDLIEEGKQGEGLKIGEMPAARSDLTEIKLLPPEDADSFIHSIYFQNGHDYELVLNGMKDGVGGIAHCDDVFDLMLPTFRFIEKDEAYIKVISPNGGEEWATGNTYDITWESKGVDKVDIGYKREGSGAEINGWIGKDVPALQRKCFWTITEEVFPGSEYIKGWFYIIILRSGDEPGLVSTIGDMSDGHVIINREAE